MNLARARVTVVLPCHNYGRFVRAAVASLKSQTLSSWDCVVVDDGSTDDTGAILAEFVARDRRFRLIRQEHTGVSAARNTGLAQATSEYIQFLDADDRLEPDKLRAHVEYLDDNPGTDIAYGDMATFDEAREDSIQAPLDLGTPTGSGDSIVEAFVIRNRLAIHAPLFRRSIVGLSGPFSEDLAHLEDWDFWMRCALAGGQFAYLPAPDTRALIRLHPASASRDHRRMLAATVELRRRFMQLELPPGARAANARLLGRAEVKLALSDLRRWRLRQSTQGLARAARQLLVSRR